MSSVLRGLIVGELLLGLIALVWALRSDTPIPYGFDVRAGVIVLGLTGVLTAVNFTLFAIGRRYEVNRHVYAFFEEEIFPVIREATVLDIIFVSAVAGFAEELLFRGMLQPRMGIVASSVLFGLLHGPDYKLWPFAVWAAVVSIFFGLLYRETDNIAIPMAVHGLYDAIALAYIKWKPPQAEPDDPFHES